MLLGYPIVVNRVKGAPATPKYLTATHVCAAARRGAARHGVAAKDTLNWLTGVQDEFNEKAKTVPLAALAALREPIGIGIFVVAVLRAL